jgi:hypothetical protein
MKKNNVPNKIFHECNGHSKCCLESDFGATFLLCTPTMNVPSTLILIIVSDFTLNYCTQGYFKLF